MKDKNKDNNQSWYYQKTIIFFTTNIKNTKKNKVEFQITLNYKIYNINVTCT